MRSLVTIGSGVFWGAGVEFSPFLLTCVVVPTCDKRFNSFFPTLCWCIPTHVCYSSADGCTTDKDTRCYLLQSTHVDERAIKTEHKRERGTVTDLAMSDDWWEERTDIVLASACMHLQSPVHARSE